MLGGILQPSHLLLIVIVALLVLGPKRFPGAGKSLARGLRDFKAAIDTDQWIPHDDARSHQHPLGEVRTDRGPHDEPPGQDQVENPQSVREPAEHPIPRESIALPIEHSPTLPTEHRASVPTEQSASGPTEHGAKPNERND